MLLKSMNEDGKMSDLFFCEFLCYIPLSLTLLFVVSLLFSVSIQYIIFFHLPFFFIYFYFQPLSSVSSQNSVFLLHTSLSLFPVTVCTCSTSLSDNSEELTCLLTPHVDCWLVASCFLFDAQGQHNVHNHLPFTLSMLLAQALVMKTICISYSYCP